MKITSPTRFAIPPLHHYANQIIVVTFGHNKIFNQSIKSYPRTLNRRRKAPLMTPFLNSSAVTSKSRSASTCVWSTGRVFNNFSASIFRIIPSSFPRFTARQTIRQSRQEKGEGDNTADMAELNGPKMKECKKMGWKEKTMIIQCWKQQQLKGRNDTFPGGMNYEYRSHWGGKAYKKEGLIQQHFFIF